MSGSGGFRLSIDSIATGKPACFTKSRKTCTSSRRATGLKLLSDFAGIYVVNFLHDPLCPLNAGRYEPIRASALWSAKKIVRRPHVHRRQDRCHDSNHPLPALVHNQQRTPFALYSPTRPAILFI